MTPAARTSGTTRGLLLALGTCAIYVALAYGNVVFQGQTLVATANHHPFDDRWVRLRPGGDPFRAYWNWHDQGAAWWQWEPAAEFFERAYRKGTVPLWDPTIAGGVDAHVNVTQGQYFPPYVALLLSGNGPVGRDVYYLALVMGTGICAFLLFHRNGLHPIACATAAAAWMTGGAMTLNVNSIVGQSISVLPLMVLAMDWLLDRPAWSRVVVLGLVVAFSTLSSFMPVVLSGLVLVGIQLVVYLAARRLEAARGDERAAVVLAMAGTGVALGLAATAFLLVPVLAASKSDPVFSAWYGRTGSQHFMFQSWPGLLSRVFPYGVTQGTSAYVPSNGDVWMFDVGVVPVLLALLASRNGGPRSRRLAVFLAAGCAFVLARLFGVPPAQWIASLPVFRTVHFVPYGGAALGFTVAGLAAVGVEGVIRGRPTTRRAAVVTACVLVLLYLALEFGATHRVNPGERLREPAFELARLGFLAALVTGVAWLRSLGVLGGRTAGVLLLVILSLELVPLARTPRFLRAPVWDDLPPYVRMLRADPSRFRIHAIHGWALPPNTYQGVGLEGIGSRHAFNVPRYNFLVRRYFTHTRTVYPFFTSLLPLRRVLLDVLNVKYVIAYDPSPEELAALESAGLKVAAQDAHYVLLRNETVWPRAYVARRHHIARDILSASVAVGDLTAPGDVVLEERPAFAREGDALESAECQIRQYEYGRVRIEAVTPQPAVVVLSDSFGAGWTATVNGQPARILAANVAFRAVEVPAGRSEVEFRYETPGLRAGMAISGIALASLAGLALWPVARRRIGLRARVPRFES